MTDDDTSRTEHNITPEQEMARLRKETEASIIPLTRAIRKKLAGKPSDIAAARLEARALLDAVVEQVSPTTCQRAIQSFSPDDLIASYWDRIAERGECATTGFASLNDALSGGLEQGRLMVLLGAPGSGKTTFANQMADHVASIKRPVLYVTSEDTPFTLLAKTIARRSTRDREGIDYNAVLRGDSKKRELINKALQEYGATDNAKYLRYVDATRGISLDDIAEQAERHFQALKSTASGAPLLVVDYLQRLSRFENLGSDARQSATVYVGQLRAMACDLHCTAIVLSAMNRASGYSAGSSTIASSKESGDIEYSSDVLMAIGAKEDEIEPAPGLRRWMLRIDKNRQGATTYDLSTSGQNHIYLDWYAARQQFTEVDQGSYSAPIASSNGSNVGRNGRRRANG